MNKIYFITPPNSPTGGPTLLHQAAKELRILGFEAFILYDGADSALNPVHIKFKDYNIPFITNVKLIKNSDILILPEQYYFIRKYSFFKVTKVIWWLSVDNYIVSKFYDSSLGKITKLFLKILSGSNYKFIEHFEIANKIISKESNYINKYQHHWVQSNYALEFVKNFNISPSYVGDYLYDTFDNSKDLNKKQNIVCYSPAKGFGITKTIIKNNPNINFVAIQNMTPKEVRDLLIKSKIYIDFGNHPGQDRIPREARICNCVVIVGKRGSATNLVDVPIPNSYKFQKKMKKKQLNELQILFKDIFDNYTMHLENQKDYLKMIRLQKEKFIRDLSQAIKSI